MPKAGRPLTTTPSAATLRKRRQLERQRADGRKVLVVNPSPETRALLEDLAALTGGNVKQDAEMILRRGARNALREAQALAERMRPIALQQQTYTPYARYLDDPKASLRVGHRILLAADWHRIAAEIGAYHATVSRWGWSRAQADAFLARCASGTVPVIRP